MWIENKKKMNDNKTECGNSINVSLANTNDREKINRGNETKKITRITKWKYHKPFYANTNRKIKSRDEREKLQWPDTILIFLLSLQTFRFLRGRE